MSRRITLAISLTVLLLAGIVPASQAAGPARQSQMAALTHSYFTVLNHGLTTGNFSGLSPVFAARATLTQRISLGRDELFPQVTTVRGRTAIISFYHQLYATSQGTHWFLGAMHQTSATTMVSYARALGAKNAPPMHSTQRLTVRSGKIISLEWTIYYLPG